MPAGPGSELVRAGEPLGNVNQVEVTKYNQFLLASPDLKTGATSHLWRADQRRVRADPVSPAAEYSGHCRTIT